MSYSLDMPVRVLGLGLELDDKWVNVGDINYKKDGGLFIRLYSDYGDMEASIIDVRGWDNMPEDHASPRNNLVMYGSVVIYPMHLKKTEERVGSAAWVTMDNTARMLAAAEVIYSDKGGYDSYAEIETPYTKGVDYYVTFYKDVAMGKYSGPLRTKYTVADAIKTKEEARKGGK